MTKKILLIDDSITIHRVVKEILGEERFTVISADNSEEGVNLIKTEKPDLILCDLSMEGIDGYKLCEIVRSEPELKDVPVILLVEVFELLDTERASAVGASGHIIKPFEPKELINKIESFMEIPKEDLKVKTGSILYDIERSASGGKDTEALESAVRKILDETMKDAIEKTLKEMLQTSLLPMLKDSIDKVLWEVLPDTAEMLISKEIERLRAGE